MRRYWILAGIALLCAGCNDPKKPNNSNFTTTINQYLQKHNNACVAVNKLPADLTPYDQGRTDGPGPKMRALEMAGLLSSSNQSVVFPGLGAQMARHYEVTGDGKPYLTPGDDVDQFCYGQAQVASIVKWTDPTASGETQVTYAPKIGDVAPWAQRPDIQKAFPDVKQVLSNSSPGNQTLRLHLTDSGWQVVGS